MKNPWVILGVITIILFGGAIWYSGVSSERNNEGVEVKQHIKGNPDAAVKLVEFSDFQCPSCAAAQPVVKDVLEQYGSDMSFEYRHFPLASIHPHAMAAATAAEAASQQGKFFEFHDKLFENQAEWSSSATPTGFFLKYAEEIGLDVEMFRRHMNSSLLRDRVREDFAEARRLELSGTPTFLLNGQILRYQSYQELVSQIALAIDPSAAGTGTEAVAPAVRFGL